MMCSQRSIRNFFLLSSGILTGCLLVSCERTVSFDLTPSAQKVVVEGTIESGLPPYVRFSKSIGFFSNVNLDTLANTFLHDADMTVSDGMQTIALKEYPIMLNGVTGYVYTVDTADPTALNFKGVSGTTYTLTINYEGKTYSATTTIPALLPLDSVWAQAPPPEELPDGYPDAMWLYAQYTDPPVPGNKARYFTSRNGQPFLPPYFSVYDDDVINGTTVQMQLPAGMDKMDSFNADTYGYFYKGDTVVVKWCSIDDKVFNFWRTLEYSYGSSGNPFSAPVEISTNISNGALGVWQGYGVTYDTVVIAH